MKQGIHPEYHQATVTLVKTNNSIPMGWGLKKSQPFLLLKKNKKEGEG